MPKLKPASSTAVSNLQIQIQAQSSLSHPRQQQHPPRPSSSSNSANRQMIVASPTFRAWQSDSVQYYPSSLVGARLRASRVRQRDMSRDISTKERNQSSQQFQRKTKQNEAHRLLHPNRILPNPLLLILHKLCLEQFLADRAHFRFRFFPSGDNNK